MKWLLDFINDFFPNLYRGFKWILDSLITVLSYVCFFLYDGFLSIVSSFMSVIDLSAVAFNCAAQYSHLPPQLIWLINQVNIPQGLTYIAGAITIRMTLNLIPAAFTRV